MGIYIHLISLEAAVKSQQVERETNMKIDCLEQWFLSVDGTARRGAE